MNTIFDAVVESREGDKTRYRNYLNGNWSFPDSVKEIEVTNPATGEVFAAVPMCAEHHVRTAVESAMTIQESDPFSPLERMGVIDRAAEILQGCAEDIARIITLETGKPVAGAEKEVSTTVERLHLVREEARVLYGDYIPGEWVEDTENKFAIVLRKPLGVVAAISPFNYPLFIGAAKIIPALVAGNSVVVKTASDTPLSLLLFTRILEEAGLTSGRIQILTGKGSTLGSALAENRNVSAISFTGSTSAGRAIADQAGMKRLHLELGGNAAAIVFADADIPNAVSEICKGAFKNAGQRCDAISRVLVHKDIYTEFIDSVKEEAASYCGGDPFDSNTTIGPLINREALAKVNGLVQDAVENGAEVVCGAKAENLFYPATVLEKVTPSMDVAVKEIFGPVMPVIRVENDEEAVAISNASDYGLDSCIFTCDLNRAIEISKVLDDGTVNVNGAPAHGVGHFPFGGNKKSGMGREGLKYSINEMTRLHTIVFSE